MICGMLQVLTSVLSNELFKSAAVSEWDIVNWFKTVADMGSIDHARRAANILTRGTRLIPSDPEEGLKYYLQVAAGGMLTQSCSLYCDARHSPPAASFFYQACSQYLLQRIVIYVASSEVHPPHPPANYTAAL